MNAVSSVLMFGDFGNSYPREVTLRRAFEANGVSVEECRLGDEMVLVGWRKVLFLPFAYLKLLYYFISGDHEDADAIFVPRNNHLLLPLAKLLSVLTGVPLVYDAFDPDYRTAVMEGEGQLKRRIKYALEYLTLRLPDRVLVTTPAFGDLYSEDYSLPEDRFVVVPAGADEELFYPRDGPLRDEFTVLYWGNFHPHHGVDVVLDAAERLSNTDVRFVLVGDGRHREQHMERVQREGMDHVTFTGRVSDEELAEHIASAHVCLGVFSDHLLARCSVTNKVYEAMAMGKPIITERSPATITISDDALVLVTPGSADELAEAIRRLQEDHEKREAYARRSREIYGREFSESALGKNFIDAFNHA